MTWHPKILLKTWSYLDSSGHVVALDAPTPATVHSLWSSAKFFTWQSFKGCSHPCCLCTVSSMFWYNTLWTAASLELFSGLRQSDTYNFHLLPRNTELFSDILIFWRPKSATLKQKGLFHDVFNNIFCCDILADDRVFSKIGQTCFSFRFILNSNSCSLLKWGNMQKKKKSTATTTKNWLLIPVSTLPVHHPLLFLPLSFFPCPQIAINSYYLPSVMKDTVPGLHSGLMVLFHYSWH